VNERTIKRGQINAEGRKVRGSVDVNTCVFSQKKLRDVISPFDSGNAIATDVNELRRVVAAARVEIAFLVD